MEKGEQPRALQPCSAKPPPDVYKGFSVGEKRGILGRANLKKLRETQLGGK